MRVPLQRIHTCAYCPDKSHIIDSCVYPNDVIAKKDSSGKSICGNCQEAAIGEETIKYKDGNSIERRDANTMGVEKIIVKDLNGNILQTTTINGIEGKIYSVNSVDGSRSDYNDDGSYLTTWPKKADGSQQFYDSKQQKVFVRDANGNIIPPKE